MLHPDAVAGTPTSADVTGRQQVRRMLLLQQLLLLQLPTLDELLLGRPMQARVKRCTTSEALWVAAWGGGRARAISASK